jgi:hypothetical protein
MSQVQRVILVGHCGSDGRALERMVLATLPGVRVSFADDEEALNDLVDDASLLLVNRVLDGDFKDNAGVALIARLRERHLPGAGAGAGAGAGPRMMLISNYPDAQTAAVAAGALPGFGKSEMAALGVERLRQAARNGV